jgi:hypothetical protein
LGIILPRRGKSTLNSIECSKSRKICEIADYDIDEKIVEPVASLKIDEDRAFLSVIKDYFGL